jgi:hypothetical protein
MRPFELALAREVGDLADQLRPGSSAGMGLAGEDEEHRALRVGR